MNDEVNHPSYYTSHPKGIECINVIEDCKSVRLANVLKYIWRVCWGGKSDDLSDLKKAKWYLEREIEVREGGAKNNGSDSCYTCGWLRWQHNVWKTCAKFVDPPGEPYHDYPKP